MRSGREAGTFELATTGSAVSLNRNLLSRANILNHLRYPEIGRIRENFNKARAHARARRKKILSLFRSALRIPGISSKRCVAKRALKLFKRCGRSQSKHYHFRYCGYAPCTAIKYIKIALCLF